MTFSVYLDCLVMRVTEVAIRTITRQTHLRWITSLVLVNAIIKTEIREN